VSRPDAAQRSAEGGLRICLARGMAGPFVPPGEIRCPRGRRLTRVVIGPRRRAGAVGRPCCRGGRREGRHGRSRAPRVLVDGADAGGPEDASPARPRPPGPLPCCDKAADGRRRRCAPHPGRLAKLASRGSRRRLAGGGVSVRIDGAVTRGSAMSALRLRGRLWTPPAWRSSVTAQLCPVAFRPGRQRRVNSVSAGRRCAGCGRAGRPEAVDARAA
jgi:hypothetical protein